MSNASKARLFLMVLLASLLCVASAFPQTVQPSSGLQVVSVPEHPFLEHRGTRQIVNFDLLVRNTSAERLKLVSVKLQVFDRTGKLAAELELNENGHPPALDIVGERVLEPHGVMDIFQPFFSFEKEV